MDSHHPLHLLGVLPGKQGCTGRSRHGVGLSSECLCQPPSCGPQIPLFGIMSSDSADPFYWMRVILASNRGRAPSFPAFSHYAVGLTGLTYFTYQVWLS